MEIFGVEISFRKKPTLYGDDRAASAQAQTEGIPIENAERDPSKLADPEAGHGGYYPPVKGLSLEENHLKHSDVVNRQLREKGEDREIMGSSLRGGR